MTADRVWLSTVFVQTRRHDGQTSVINIFLLAFCLVVTTDWGPLSVLRLSWMRWRWWEQPPQHFKMWEHCGAFLVFILYPNVFHYNSLLKGSIQVFWNIAGGWWVMSLPTAQSARTDLTLTREVGGGFGSFAIPASSGCCYYIDGAADQICRLDTAKSTHQHGNQEAINTTNCQVHISSIQQLGRRELARI